MSSPQEFELKFGIPAERLTALKKALARGTLRNERLRAVYVDSEDEVLARSRVALRLRKEGRIWVQTLKARTDQSVRRLEDNVPISGAAGAAVPALDLSRHDTSAAGEVLRAALAGEPQDSDRAAAALMPRFEVDVRRSSRTVRHDSAAIEIALDIGSIRAGSAECEVRELELELKSGSEAALFSLAEHWVAAQGLWLANASKAERGYRLARGKRDATVVKAQTVLLDAACSTDDFVGAAMLNCLHQIIGNAASLAIDGEAAPDGGNDDGLGDEKAIEKAIEEGVHQLRVGIRRLRTLLRELHDAMPRIDPAWEPALRATFQELGMHRDHAVVMPQCSQAFEAAGAPDLAVPARTAPERDLQTIVRGTRFQRTLLDLLGVATLDAVASVGDGSHSTNSEDGGDGKGRANDAARSVAARLQHLHRQLARDAKRFGKLSVEHQHRARKRLKRLRYLSELSAPLFKKAAVDRFLRDMRQAQDALGELNDESTAADAYRLDAEQHPHAWFAVGWLASRQAGAVERSRRALGRVSDAKRFWKKFLR